MAEAGQSEGLRRRQGVDVMIVAVPWVQGASPATVTLIRPGAVMVPPTPTPVAPAFCVNGINTLGTKGAQAA